MNPDLQDTLRMVEEAAAGFARPDAERARKSRDEHAGFDADVWKSFADMGWLAALPPEELGGVALGMEGAAIIAEWLGYGCYTEPYVAAGVMAAQCLLDCPTGQTRDALVAALASGEALVTLAWQPAQGSLSPGDCAIVAEQSGETLILDGQARFVVGGMVADTILVCARRGDDLLLVAIDSGAGDIALTGEVATDGTQLAVLTLERLPVAADRVLATGGAAHAALDTGIVAGVLCTGAELLGLIERMMEITQDYLRTRKQFGKLIGSFQALQHRAVDMWIQKALTRAALRAAIGVFSDPASSADARSSAASSVKARASQAALLIAGQSVQLHGAIGTTDEYELGVYVNRALNLASQFGNAAAHRRRFGDLVQVEER